MAPAPKTNTPTPAPAAGKPEKAEKAARKPAAADESKPKKAAAPVAAEPKKAAAAAVAAEPKKAAAAVAAPVVDAGAATVKPSATSKLVDNMDILDAELVKQDELINSLLKQSRAVKELRKSIGRHSINAKKAEGVRVAKVLKRKALPHKGLNDPTLASDTMNNFLGNAPGTKVPRQQAYAAIRAYIDAHGLKAGAPSGFAKVDAKLGKLFVGMTEFKVFSIQTHLKDHFAKKDQAAPVAK